jgi:hypothetical protein
MRKRWEGWSPQHTHTLTHKQCQKMTSCLLDSRTQLPHCKAALQRSHQSSCSQWHTVTHWRRSFQKGSRSLRWQSSWLVVLCRQRKHSLLGRACMWCRCYKSCQALLRKMRRWEGWSPRRTHTLTHRQCQQTTSCQLRSRTLRSHCTGCRQQCLGCQHGSPLGRQRTCPRSQPQRQRWQSQLGKPGKWHWRQRQQWHSNTQAHRACTLALQRHSTCLQCTRHSWQQLGRWRSLGCSWSSQRSLAGRWQCQRCRQSRRQWRQGPLWPLCSQPGTHCRRCCQRRHWWCPPRKVCTQSTPRH